MSSYRLQHLVKGGEPFTVVLADGAVAGTEPGDQSGSADLLVHLSKADVAALGAGELLLDEGFMQGRIKIEGSMGVVMDLLPVLRDPAYGTAVAAAG